MNASPSSGVGDFDPQIGGWFSPAKWHRASRLALPDSSLCLFSDGRGFAFAFVVIDTFMHLTANQARHRTRPRDFRSVGIRSL